MGRSLGQLGAGPMTLKKIKTLESHASMLRHNQHAVEEKATLRSNKSAPDGYIHNHASRFNHDMLLLLGKT